ncbi:primosomal replication protein N [Chromatiaceae bacterium AAb-1]|nr:primosomal replication protein N [Chromatiaceae bacterium AAb-1]
MDNYTVLHGMICRHPEHSESPAGIPHTVLVIEHRSMQQEAGLNRQAYVRMQIVMSGIDLQQQARELKSGQYIKVTGFLNRHQSRNGQARLVLHARQIEQIS